MLSRYTYNGYVKRLRAGYFSDPWVVHLGSLYMFFSGNEEEAITTVKVALSFYTTPLVVRTLAFLYGMHEGVEQAYDVYRRYFRKLFSSGFQPYEYQWELMFAGDLAFYLNMTERGWFYYKKYPKPRSPYMLRRKARIFFESSPSDSKALYEVLYNEGKKLSVGDILRYAYLLGPRKGRAFLNKMQASWKIKILGDAADGKFDDILQYIENIGESPVYEGVITKRIYKSQYVALSVEVLAHLLGTVYMPWGNMFLRKHSVFRDRMYIPHVLWDSGYAYEYHFAYLPPWWKMGVEYLEYRLGVKMLVLSKRHAGKRRCLWGNKLKCSEAIMQYDTLYMPIIEVY